ncbi:transposase [Bifidobacterium boum]|uniref:transposase n=1 Tax=Bifidobacterium TaxID=1678 RepID=UPI001378BA46
MPPSPRRWWRCGCRACPPGGSSGSPAAAAAAIAGDDDGRKRVVGFDVFDTESYAGWKSFLSSLRARGMDGVRLVVSDDHCGLRKASPRSSRAPR